jgi:ribosomal protein L37E
VKGECNACGYAKEKKSYNMFGSQATKCLILVHFVPL